ncbi:MAG: CvpA family protein [Ardenticatenaceae bacterium]|nr:CvpA family protein [Ardenticatenaceae bacterium]
MFWFDLLLLLIILGSMLVGFQQGVIRQAVNLLALFFGLLVAATYQGRLSRAFTGLIGGSGDFARQTVIFVIIVVAVWGLVNLAMAFGFRETRLRTGQTLDRLLGLVLGVINGVVWSLVLVLVLSFMTSVPWPQRYDSVRRFLEAGLDASLLRPTILQLLPVVGSALKPLLPSGLPALFYQKF